MSKLNVSRIQITGPLGSYASGFAAELSRVGYAPSSRDHQVWLLAHLSRWMAVNGVEPGALTRQVVDEFVAVRRAAGYTTHRSARALEPLIGYLHSLGVVGPADEVELTPVDVLLKRYSRYLTVERGLASSTIRLYVDPVRPFVAGRVVGGELDLSGLTAGEVRRVPGRVLPWPLVQVGEGDSDGPAVAVGVLARGRDAELLAGRCGPHGGIVGSSRRCPAASRPARCPGFWRPAIVARRQAGGTSR